MSVDLSESHYYQKILSRGREEGLMAEAQAILLKVAGKKFGPPPAPIEAAVRALTDRERLERMIDRIFDATSWDDLLATP